MPHSFRCVRVKLCTRRCTVSWHAARFAAGARLGTKLIPPSGMSIVGSSGSSEVIRTAPATSVETAGANDSVTVALPPTGMTSGSGGPLSVSPVVEPGMSAYELTVIGESVPLLISSIGKLSTVPDLGEKGDLDRRDAQVHRLEAGRHQRRDDRLEVGRRVERDRVVAAREPRQGAVGDDLLEVGEAVAVGVEVLDVPDRVDDRLRADVELLLDRGAVRVARAGARPAQVAVAAGVVRVTRQRCRSRW